MNTTVSTAKRQRLYIRPLVAGVLAAALLIPFVWFTLRFYSAKQQEHAIAQLPGVVLYRHQQWEFGGPEGPILENTPPGPEWLRRILGDDFFFVPDDLFLAKYAIEDSDLAVVKALPTLRKVDLSGTSISDKALEYLAPLRNIEELKLEGTHISSAAMIHLRSFKQLRLLHLPEFEAKSFNIDDLEVLSELTNLEELRLHYNPLGDKGLGYLSGLSRLRVLGINGVGAPPGSFRHFSGFDNLEQLVAENEDVCDDDIEHLKGTKLRVLFLDGRNLTERSYLLISGFKDLQTLKIWRLDVNESNVHFFQRLEKLRLFQVRTMSQAARQQLENALPNLEILASVAEGESRVSSPFAE